VEPAITLTVGGSIVTDATGAGVTVIVAVPLCPSLVAEIVAEPAATAVINPLVELTVATRALSEAQTIERPVRTDPFESLSTAAA
jgi:hypothetical protein